MKKTDRNEKKDLSPSRLKSEREQRGWTRAYVSTQVNCPDPQMVGRWERGTVSPSPQYRQALCQLFGKNAQELGLFPQRPGEINGHALHRPGPKPEGQPSTPRQASSLVFFQGHPPIENPLFLPPQLTSFIGREQEIVTVCMLLRRPEVRLLTLTGPGGVGKTRLALQAVAHLIPDFADGIRFLSLVETSTPDLVVPTLARQLGLQEIGGQPLFDLLKAFLKEQHLLLLLDNFEQVVEAAPILLDLLGCCPHLKLLVTSRIVLRVSGEYECFVPPLPLPDLTRLPEPELLVQYPAIALFLERTQGVLPHFAMNETNAQVIAEICTCLDGLPLAIELAVPRLKLLSPHLLLAQLDHHRLNAYPINLQLKQEGNDWKIVSLDTF